MTSCHISLVKLKQHLSLFLCLISQRTAQKHATTFNRISLSHFLFSGGFLSFFLPFPSVPPPYFFFFFFRFPPIPPSWIKVHSAVAPLVHPPPRVCLRGGAEEGSDPAATHTRTQRSSAPHTRWWCSLDEFAAASIRAESGPCDRDRSLHMKYSDISHL